MPSYRYPGPRPFEENDINLFFGRDRDIKNLLTFINVEQLTVLFSKSGLGKSSLINAGIIPELRKKNYEIILCRLNSYVNKQRGENPGNEAMSPLQKVFSEITARFNKTTTFLDNLITGTQQFSLWHQFKNLQISNPEKKTYFIFFDQFEELFTYPQEQVKEFKENLAELLSASIPQEYLDKINQSENDPSSENLTDEQLGVLYDPIPVKLLFTIRSDKFSLLTNLKDAIPGMVTKTYELKPFNAAEATEAIRKPASIAYDAVEDNFISNSFTYDDDAIKKMLGYLSDEGTEDIESFQLQVLCRYVEDMVLENKKQNNELRNITATQLGDIKNIFEAYYNRLIEGIDKDKVRNVKRLFEDGLIFEKDKMRVSLYEGQIEAGYGVDEVLLNKLVATHLIRCEPDANGKEKYELSHDSLIEPILKSKEKRIVEEKASKFKKRAALYLSIAAVIILIFGFVLYIFSQSSKRDKLKFDFLESERGWFYLLDSVQRKDVLKSDFFKNVFFKNDFLFLADKDPVKYQNIKYSYRCAAYANLNAEADYLLALKFAQEGYIKDSNDVTRKSFDSLLKRPNISFPSVKIECRANVNNTELTPDKKSIIGVTSEGIFWYSAVTGTCTDSLIAAKYRSNYSAFSPAGDYLLYETYYSDTTYLLNVLTKQLIFFENSTPSYSLAFDVLSGDDKFFVHENGYDKIIVKSFDGDSLGEYLLPLKDYDEINKLSISPDGRYVAAGTTDGLVFLMDRQAGKKEGILMMADADSQMKAHSDIVNSISFSHNSKFLLTGSEDKTVDVWNVNTRRLIKVFENADVVTRCRFSNNDGSIIVGQANDGSLTKWVNGKADSAGMDQNNTIVQRPRNDTGFKKDQLQLFGLDSDITSVNYYNNDFVLIASSNSAISLWNMNKTFATIDEVIKAKAIAPLRLQDKARWNMISKQELSAITKKKEILSSLEALNDSLYLLTEITKVNRQTFSDFTDLMPELYSRLQDCRDDKLDKLDSLNLFNYMSNCYNYKIQLDENGKSGRFDSVNLYRLITFRQQSIKLDTLQSECFNNLLNAYLVPMGYYLQNKQYDSALFWNNQILTDNKGLDTIKEIKNAFTIIYQYKVVINIANSNLEKAEKSLREWPEPHEDLGYILCAQLVGIFGNPNYVFSTEKFKTSLKHFDLKEATNQQKIADMDGALFHFLNEEGIDKKWSPKILDNLSAFDDYIYSLTY